MQDKKQMHSLIQDIVKLDLNKFDESRQRELKKLRSSSGSSAAQSVKTKPSYRRQGTPAAHDQTIATDHSKSKPMTGTIVENCPDDKRTKKNEASE